MAACARQTPFPTRSSDKLDSDEARPLVRLLDTFVAEYATQAPLPPVSCDDLRKLMPDKPPVRLEPFAECLGIIASSQLLSSTLAAIYYYAETRALSVVNSRQDPGRRRFAVAHHIAWYALKDYSVSDVVHVDRAYRFHADPAFVTPHRAADAYANFLALKLLLPEVLLLPRLPRRGLDLDLDDDKRVADLARTFRVTPAAIRMRLAHLHQIPSPPSEPPPKPQPRHPAKENSPMTLAEIIKPFDDLFGSQTP